MRHLPLAILTLCAATLTAADITELPVPGGVKWWGYRGYLSTGISHGNPPIASDDATGMNVQWKVALPNWGHSQPVVVGDQVVVISEGGWPEGVDFPVLEAYALSDGAKRWSLSLDHVAHTGLSDKEQAAARAGWSQVMADFRTNYTLFNGIASGDKTRVEAARAEFEKLGRKIGPYKRGYGQLRSLSPKYKKEDMQAARKAGFALETWQHDCGMSQAAFGQTFPTPVTDGETIYIATAWGSFFAVSADGKLKWCAVDQGDQGEYCRNGRSPLIYGDLFISDIMGKVRAFDRATGALKWSGTVLTETWMNPIVITAGGTDVLLCFNKKAFRLPDGQPLTIEGGTDFGAHAIVKYDERDVAFFSGGGEHGGWEKKGSCPTPPPSALRFSLEGETLKAEILWCGINGEKVTSHTGLLYHDGLLYHTPTGCSYEPLTGKRVQGPSDRKKARDQGITAKHGHLILIAGDRMYGLGEQGETGLLDVRRLGGAKLAHNRFGPAPVEGTKQTQIIEQHGFNKWGRFNYSKPFTIHGDHIFVRNYDYLWCLGNNVAGTVADDDASVAKASGATAAADLLPLLSHAGAKVRLTAVRKLGELKDASAKEALVTTMKEDAQPEVRGAAVVALDAIEADAGSKAAREWLAPLATAGRKYWYKPEHVEPWELNKHIVGHLGSSAGSVLLPLIADTNEDTSATGVYLLSMVDWQDDSDIRAALITATTKGSRYAAVMAAKKLAAKPVRDDALEAFRAMIAEPGTRKEELNVVVRGVASTLEGEALDTFLRETIEQTKNINILTTAAEIALKQDTLMDGLVDLLVTRATGKEAGHTTPRAATNVLLHLKDKALLADAQKRILDGGQDHWSKGAAATNLLMQAEAHTDAALAYVAARVSDDPKAHGNRDLASMMERSASKIAKTEHADAAVAILRRLLKVANYDVQNRSLTAIERMGIKGAAAKAEVEALAAHDKLGKRVPGILKRFEAPKE